MKKLKETLVTVQQLDKNMSNLRSWLCRIEAELSRPVTYSVCHHQEIKKKLAEQQVRTRSDGEVPIRLLLQSPMSFPFLAFTHFVSFLRRLSASC